MSRAEYLHADWPAPANVSTLVTTRRHPQGQSRGDFARFNLGLSTTESPRKVSRNRQLLRPQLPAAPLWLQQVHGKRVIDAVEYRDGIEADGTITTASWQVCTVLSADCLPVLLCDQSGSCVGAVHAGWRGLSAGIIQAAIKRLPVPGSRLLAWLGPAISQRHYAVDEEFRDHFVAQRLDYQTAFRHSAGQWHADLYAIARWQLRSEGVTQVYGGEFCTFADPQRFYSFRRDGRTGRQASMIWLH